LIDVDDVLQAHIALANITTLKQLWKLPEYMVNFSSPQTRLATIEWKDRDSYVLGYSPAAYCAGLTGCINSDADCQHACWIRSLQAKRDLNDAGDRELHYHTWVGEREVILIGKPYSADWDESYWVCDNPIHIEKLT